MVSFYGLCDGKIMIQKTYFFWFLCGNVYFFRKIFGGALSNWEQLIVNFE